MFNIIPYFFFKVYWDICFNYLFSVDIKEEDLNTSFTVCGEVPSVRIIRDSATGIGKGFGYVLFKGCSFAVKLPKTFLVKRCPCLFNCGFVFV